MQRTTKYSLLAVVTAALVTASASAAAAAPPNDAFNYPHIMPGTGDPTMPYVLAGASIEAGEPSIGSDASVWFAWKPAKTGGAYVDVCGVPAAHRVRAWRLLPGKQPTFGNITPANAGDAAVAGSSFCRDRWIAKAGEQYYLQIGGHGNWSMIRKQDSESPGKPTFKGPMPSVTGPTRSWSWNPPADPDIAGFRCAVDGQLVTPCDPAGTTVSGLGEGAHFLQVYALDSYGNASPPLIHNWGVDATAPETHFKDAAGIGFASPEPGATFQCSVDDAAYIACASPFNTLGLGAGSHVVRIRAVDAHGNADPTPLEISVGAPLPPKPPTGVDDEPGGGDGKPGGPEVQPPTEVVCTATANVPRRVSRAALGRGVTIRVTAANGCTAKLTLQRGSRRLFTARRTASGAGPIKLKLRASVAKGSKLVLKVQSGSTTRAYRLSVR